MSMLLWARFASECYFWRLGMQVCVLPAAMLHTFAAAPGPASSSTPSSGSSWTASAPVSSSVDATISTSDSSDVVSSSSFRRCGQNHFWHAHSPCNAFWSCQRCISSGREHMSKSRGTTSSSSSPRWRTVQASRDNSAASSSRIAPSIAATPASPSSPPAPNFSGVESSAACNHKQSFEMIP